jgi:hypothetical protein
LRDALLCRPGAVLASETYRVTILATSHHYDGPLSPIEGVSSV